MVHDELPELSRASRVDPASCPRNPAPKDCWPLCESRRAGLNEAHGAARIHSTAASLCSLPGILGPNSPETMRLPGPGRMPPGQQDSPALFPLTPRIGCRIAWQVQPSNVKRLTSTEGNRARIVNIDERQDGIGGGCRPLLPAYDVLSVPSPHTVPPFHCNAHACMPVYAESCKADGT